MLSVAMIVKNEEKNLRCCLDSVKDIAEEIVIVDTGSTDETISIAREYTDRVYEHEWNDSFAEARNIALDYATGPWILQIDADEELTTPERLLPLMASDLSAVWVRIISLMPSGGEGMSYFPRLYRKEAAHYEWRVHNQLIATGKHDFSDIEIYHYGYNLSPEEMAAKYQRQERLLRIQLEEMPSNSIVWSNFIRILRAQRKWREIEEAVAEFQQKSGNGEIEHTDHAAQIILLDNLCAKIELGKYEQAIIQGDSLLGFYPENVDAHNLMGGLCLYLHAPEKAIFHYNHYLALIERARTEVQWTTLIWDSYGEKSQIGAWRGLGEAYLSMGRFDLSLLAFNKARGLSGEEYDRDRMRSALHGLSEIEPAIPYEPVTLSIQEV